MSPIGEYAISAHWGSRVFQIVQKNTHTGQYYLRAFNSSDRQLFADITDDKAFILPRPPLYRLAQDVSIYTELEMHDAWITNCYWAGNGYFYSVNREGGISSTIREDHMVPSCRAD